MHVQPPATLELRLSVTDPQLDDEEREALTQALYRQIRESDDELGEVQRVQASAAPGTKSATSALLGILTILLSGPQIRAFFNYLSERLRGREITLEMDDPQSGRIKITARSRDDMAIAGDKAALILAQRSKAS